MRSVFITLSMGLVMFALACGDEGGPIVPGVDLGADLIVDLTTGGDQATFDGPSQDVMLTDGPAYDGPALEAAADGPLLDAVQDGPIGDGNALDATSGDVTSADAGTGDAQGSDAPAFDAATPDAASSDAASPDAATPSLVCTTVTPKAGSNSAAVTLTLDGDGMPAGTVVDLVDLVTLKVTQLGVATLSDTDKDGTFDRAVVTVPAGTAQGLYAVWIVTPTGTTKASCGTYASTAQSPPTVTDVTPTTAWQGDPVDTQLSDQPVTITGTGFVSVPAVQFVNIATKKIYTTLTVGYINATSLTSSCPSESLSMPVGDYYVDVINPSLLWARWMKGGSPGIFKVTATPPPEINDVTPFKIPVNAGGGSPVAAVTITGNHFNAGSKVVLLLPGGGTKDMTSTITAVQVNASGADTIKFNWDNTVVGLTVGIYPLRVINPDGQYDTYFSMLVEHAVPGKLNSDQWKKVSSLLYPRERHASTAGFDVFGNSYVYTVGGTSLPSGGSLTSRPRPVLGNTEISEVNVFGVPAAASRLSIQLDPAVNLSSVDPKHGAIHKQNLLVTKRTGLTMVRAGLHLYAIGGASQDTWYPAVAGSVTALKTVERARIMGYESRPNLSLPSAKAVSKGLPQGAWYYRVAAVGGEGESLPSREVAALNVGGVITLKWLPVTSASSYLVYRSLASDGRAGTTRLLKAGVSVSANTFVDDGQGALAPAPGRLRGKLLSGGSMTVGTWTYRVSAKLSGQSETLAGYPLTMTTSAGSQTIKLAWDPVPGATYSLYRTSQVNGTGAAYLLSAGLTATTYTEFSPGVVGTKVAPEGTAPLPSGALTRWKTLSSQLQAAREGADAVVVKAVDGSPTTTNEPSYIFIVGGRSTNTLNAAYLATTERAQVDPLTGTLGAWSTVQGASGALQLNTPRAFFPLLTTQGRHLAVVAPPPVAPPCPDNDGDGFTACACGGKDCDDTNATIYPGAPEICGDGIDQDCDKGCATGTDLACNNCATPDADGDGFKRPACGGNDCNDADASICPDPTKCPEIPCDGIDQDCDGIDPCGPGDILLSLLPPGGLPGGAQMVTMERAPQACSAFFPGSLAAMAASAPEEPAYLVVLYGDQSYKSPGKNTGLETAEVALVQKNGALSAWTLQSEKIMGNLRYGNAGLLYHDFAFSFRGLLSESLGDDPPVGQIWNNVYRYQIDTTSAAVWVSPPPATFLYNLNPAGSPLNVPRVYQSVVRLNAYIFSIAGNGGSALGPTTTVERIKQ